MNTQMPANYYNRHDPAQHYEQHLFVPGAVQTAEFNELQSHMHDRLRGVADALFRDGDVVRDARIVVNADTGATTCESGAIYLRGAVRGVAPASLSVPTLGVIAVGIYLRESVVTYLEDPALRDPAVGTRNYMEPGAARLKVEPVWGWSGDGQAGEFYPVYTVEDGVVRAKEPPPQLDSVTQALARYDRDSAGGSYVVSGLSVAAAADLPGGEQVYTVAEGRARVAGYGVELTTSRRLVHATAPDLRFIDSEPHTSTTAGSQRITLDRAPVGEITQVRITAERTVALTHGGYTGAKDPLPDTSVLSIVSVSQLGTTYIPGSDYKLTAGQVDWSLTGAEPAPGSAYSVTYRYIATVAPSAVDDTGCTVTGAIPDTLVLVSYTQKLPRIDRLCLDQDGAFVWLHGVAADWNPAPPAVPGNLLPLATVRQTWTAERTVVNDGVRTVSMADLAGINQRLDSVMGLIAQQRLESDIHLREAGAKRGLFTDPFRDDSQRDAGIEQGAAVVGGELTLPIAASVAPMGSDLAQPATPAFSLVTVLEQPLRTGEMKVNPYQAFDPLPAVVTLTPAVDRWTDISTSWASPLTERLTVGSGNASTTSSTTQNVLLSSSQRAAETLRPIAVQFNLSGFGPGEALASLTFDGLAVTPTAV